MEEKHTILKIFAHKVQKSETRFCASGRLPKKPCESAPEIKSSGMRGGLAMLLRKTIRPAQFASGVSQGNTGKS